MNTTVLNKVVIAIYTHIYGSAVIYDVTGTVRNTKEDLTIPTA